MPEVGDIEYKFRRTYVLVNPDPTKGPSTWRPSSELEVRTNGGGGGGGGELYDFDAVPPIVVDTKPNQPGGRTVIETSMDITGLEDRTK